jgi:hypothetical protein
MTDNHADMMDRNLALEAVRVTEAAALSASRLMGRGDEKAADQAAVASATRRRCSISARRWAAATGPRSTSRSTLWKGQR